MCGIIGYSGTDENAAEILLEGLSALEYRGYDSAGVAFFEKGKISVVKSRGRVEGVANALAERGRVSSRCGIGHTRWATHGEPSDINSHPHGNERIQIVHNGIIENYRELSRELAEEGYHPVSSTDTEIAALLIDKYYKKTRDPKRAILRATCRLKGAFALGIIFKDYPNSVYAIRHSSPLVIGYGDKEGLIASDITALLPHTRSYSLLPEGAVAEIKYGDVSFFDENNERIYPERREATWDVSEAKRGGFAHYMLKEIHEETEAVKKTLRPRIVEGLPSFEHEGISLERLKAARRIILVGCGTAYHACLIGKHYIEKYAHINASVEIASELRYKELPLSCEDAVIAVSQSGETADTLSTVKMARSAGAYTIGVVNAVASSIALESESVIYTLAGPEIAVASTKAYTTQAALLMLFALWLGFHLGQISDTGARDLASQLLNELPRAIEEILSSQEHIALIARVIHKRSNLFFIGRGVDYFSVMEASLKLKEISYIHSEAYPAGELKHGTISLIEGGVPVVALCTVSRLRDKMESNIKEVASRGALIINVILDTEAPKSGDNDGKDCTSGAEFGASASKHREEFDKREHDSSMTYFLPQMSEQLAPIACATFFQLLAYYTAVERNCDVDHPRNLAKSVTVE